MRRGLVFNWLVSVSRIGLLVQRVEQGLLTFGEQLLLGCTLTYLFLPRLVYTAPVRLLAQEGLNIQAVRAVKMPRANDTS